MKMRHSMMVVLATIGIGGGRESVGSTVTKTDPNPDVGIPYTWTVLMGGNDTASMVNFVGAWSWDSDGLGPKNEGWTHNSNWFALTLEQPATLTMRFEANANVYLDAEEDFALGTLIPGFSLYSGWQTDPKTGMMDHAYINNGPISWAPQVSYLNGGSAPTGNFIEFSIPLAAGNYSVALGGASPIEEFDYPYGYTATFTTTNVPEPSVALSALASCAALLGFRRSRRMAHTHC